MSHFILYHNHLLLTENNKLPIDLPFKHLPPATHLQFDQQANQLSYLSEKVDPPSNHSWVNLRQAFTLLPDAQFALAGRAHQIGYWAQRNRFCGRCAHPIELTLEKSFEPTTQCPNCNERGYLNPSPAIIVSVTRGDEILLARNALNRAPIYSVLAGFVSAAENLETAVAREIFEETAINVKNIHYFGSQAWPFPNSLMIGFTSDYASGSLQIDPKELQDAQWFHKENLPRTPSSISISSQLIAHFCHKQELHAP